MLAHYLSRQSNMELLRVISMIFIMVIHAQFYCIPYSIPRWLIVIGADAGVNCFVLISGYFGIHPSLLFILAMFTLAILMDQIRLVIWEGGIKFMNPVFGKINSRFHNCAK